MFEKITAEMHAVWDDEDPTGENLAVLPRVYDKLKELQDELPDTEDLDLKSSDHEATVDYWQTKNMEMKLEGKMLKNAFAEVEDAAVQRSDEKAAKTRAIRSEELKRTLFAHLGMGAQLEAFNAAAGIKNTGRLGYTHYQADVQIGRAHV